MGSLSPEDEESRAKKRVEWWDRDVLQDVYSWDLVSLGQDAFTWEQDDKNMMWHLQGIPTLHRNIFVLVASSYEVSHLFLPLAAWERHICCPCPCSKAVVRLGGEEMVR